MTTIPADLADRWVLTADSLAAVAWSLHIALNTYPIPECYEMARRYEAKKASFKAFGKAPAPKKAKKRPKGQAELW